jgi:DNA-directed RNA polymerase subunit RPC12/RpoP
MNISTRTPEGMPNRCVLCGRKVRFEPSINTLDGPCPYCGQLLWFPKRSSLKFRRDVSRAYSAGALVRQIINVFAEK